MSSAKKRKKLLKRLEKARMENCRLKKKRNRLLEELKELIRERYG